MQILINLKNYKPRFDVEYVKHNGFWLLFGHFFTAIGVLGTSYVFANYLSQSVYAEYKYLISLGALISTLSLTGMGMAITQATAKDVKGFFHYGAKLALRYGLIVTCISLTAAVYYYWNGNEKLALGLVIIAILQPFFNNSKLINGYLQGREQFKFITKLQIIRSIVESIGLILTALLFANPLYLLATFLILRTLINYIAQAFIKPEYSDVRDMDEVKKLVGHAKHMSVRNIIISAANHIDKILIFQTLNAVDLAVYSFAIALPEQFKGITKSINALLLPRFSKRSTQNIKHQLWYKTSIYIVFLTLLVTLYILAAPYIFQVLFPAYSESVFLSQVFSLGTIFSIGSLPYIGLQSQKANKTLYKIEIIGSIIQIMSIAIGLFLMGLFGVVLARVIGRSFFAGLSYYYFTKPPE